jgi:hypothetical protein
MKKILMITATILVSLLLFQGALYLYNHSQLTDATSWSHPLATLKIPTADKYEINFHKEKTWEDAPDFEIYNITEPSSGGELHLEVQFTNDRQTPTPESYAVSDDPEYLKLLEQLKQEGLSTDTEFPGDDSSLPKNEGKLIGHLPGGVEMYKLKQNTEDYDIYKDLVLFGTEKSDRLETSWSDERYDSITGRIKGNLSDLIEFQQPL